VYVSFINALNFRSLSNKCISVTSEVLTALLPYSPVDYVA